LSQENVFKILANLGFEDIDAQVYVYLAKKGMNKASNIGQALKLTKQQLYPSLKRLQSKGIVTLTLEHPARFGVLSFEKVLDLFIKAKIEETRSLQRSKTQILSDWQELKLQDDLTARFTVIEGRSFIFTKMQQMIQEATAQVFAITTVPALIQANQRGIFDYTNANSKPIIEFRFLAEVSEQNIHSLKAFLKEKRSKKLKVEGRCPDLRLTLFPQIIIKDEAEALFFTKVRTETSLIEKNDACLWTDCKPLVKAFTAVISELWHNSTEIHEKLLEIETGKESPKRLVIEDPIIARNKYNAAIEGTQKEIMSITSSEGLVEISQNELVKELKKKGVLIRVMAPIVDGNMKAAQQLSLFCPVKHVAPNYLPTTIIDGKYLFQFQHSAQPQPLDTPDQFKNVFYTNNSEFITKTQILLQEVWKNASSVNSENLKTIFGETVRVQSSAYFPGAIISPGPHGMFYPLPPNPAVKGNYPIIRIIDDDPKKELTEQDVLNEITIVQKNRSEGQLWKVYSSQAIAIIHTPEFLNFPPMLIRVHHIEEHSTWGAQNVIMVNLWLEISRGHAYVPVAVLSDNPKTANWWKTHFAGSPAASNVQIAKKDELQVRVHANTLFAGWTIPVQLLPPKYVLPPSCLLIEGYGNVKTAAYTIAGPTGDGLTAKQNGFDAFVTFMHPSSEYSGPGTDGFFVRDFAGSVSPNIFKWAPRTLETIHIKHENAPY
jgi:sugar-specific transcriptional regulator TrmB